MSLFWYVCWWNKSTRLRERYKKAVFLFAEKALIYARKTRLNDEL